MQFELTASMMCADYGNLAQEVKSLEESGIDSFHIDIMDGRYVPNFAMSLNDMRYIAGVASKPLDVHLMIEHPNNLIHLFLNNLRKGDTVYIHPEAEYHPSTTLQKIIDAGMVPGIAINPGTSVETVLEILYYNEQRECFEQRDLKWTIDKEIMEIKLKKMQMQIGRNQVVWENDMTGINQYIQYIME